MSFVDKIVNSRNYLIRLVRGKNQGEKAWWFVRVHPEKFEKYKIAVRTEALDLADYGEILYSGWGENPPEDIQQKIDEL